MDKFKSSRTLSIIGASLERMIVVLAGGVYISKVGTYVGLSTSQNGFLNVFLQFGASFQLIAIFFAGKVSQKKFVIFTVIFSMLMFGLVYLVPFLRFLGGAITLVLTIVLLLAYAFQNISNSPKYSWAYSLVDNSKKGIYTANRERIGTVVSLVFTFFVGIIIDYFEGKGDLQTAFLLIGISIIAITIFYLITFIFMKENPEHVLAEFEKGKQKGLLKKEVALLIKNKKYLRALIVAMIWVLASCLSTPFYGTYQNDVLKFSMTFISILTLISTVMIFLFSVPLFKIGDKRSFKTMLLISFALQGIAFALHVFITPQNGKVMYVIYTLFSSIGMVGINSGLLNYIYDTVESEQRTAALAIQNTVCGFAAILSTFLSGLLVDYVQGVNGNILGFTVYAQQCTSVLSLIVLIIATLVLVINKSKKQEG